MAVRNLLMELLQAQQPYLRTYIDPQQADMDIMEGVPDYGLGPVTAQSMAGRPNNFLSSYTPTAGDLVGGGVAGTVLDYGPEIAKGYLDQADAAGSAIYDAYEDPSLRNVSLAAGQTAMAMPFSNRVMAGGLGAFGIGMGDAILDDSGLLDGSAEASERKWQPETGGLKVSPSDVPFPEQVSPADRARALTGYDAEAERAQQLELEKVRAAAQAEGSAKAAAMVEAERQKGSLELQKASDKEQADKIKRESAATMRDSELAKSGSFYDTATGQYYRDMGGYAPILMGMGFGAINRLATGPGKTAMEKYGVPWLVGTSGVLTAQNAPDIYDSSTPAYNPEKKAYEIYARELPADDPDKAEALAYAQSLPDENPVSAAARERLSDPWLLAQRGGLAVVEGLGGLVGSEAVQAASRIGKGAAGVPRAMTEAVGEAPGNLLAGYNKGMARAQVAENQLTRARNQAPAPQSPQPTGPSGGPATPPANPPATPPGLQPAPQPVPPAPPPPNPVGPKGGGKKPPSGSSVRIPDKRKKEILSDLASGVTPRGVSAKEQEYIANLTSQADALAGSLGVSTQDALSAMMSTIASGARKTPYAIPGAVAGGAAMTQFDQLLNEYAQTVRDMDGDGDIDETDVMLSLQAQQR